MAKKQTCEQRSDKCAKESKTDEQESKTDEQEYYDPLDRFFMVQLRERKNLKSR